MQGTGIYIGALLTLLLMSLNACENDIEKIHKLSDEMDVPKISGKTIEVMYSDSAKVKVRILAASFRQFPDVDRPYMEFPEGLEVVFFDDSLEVESEIRADYAIYYTDERLWKATGNVVAKKLQSGDALFTEELFWNEEERFIYSNAFTKIQNKDGIFYGKNGFESHQDLNNWQLKGTSGTVNVPDEQ